MVNVLSRRTFLGMALVAGASLMSCALPKGGAPSAPDDEDIYRAPPLDPEDVDGTSLVLSDAVWRERLAPLQYHVMREKGTERAFTGEYDQHKAAGTYHCSACGNPLFSSEAKYDSGTGWPSFWAPISDAYIKTEQDTAFGMVRTEVLCARCDSHLGHVFTDGPDPTGLRYCMNSVALNFNPVENAEAAPRSQRAMAHAEADRLLFDFRSEATSGHWMIVNDGVMGGLSQSQISLSERGTAIFAGTLSLENYGGFASVRTMPAAYDLGTYAGMSLRVRGDGRRYKLRLRVDRNLDGPAYEAEFDTVADTWVEVAIPFDATVPTFRGRRLRNLPALDGGRLTQIGLMLADKQAGPFKLEVDWIRAYRPRV